MKTKSIRYKLWLDEHYLTENKIYLLQIMTRWTLFNKIRIHPSQIMTRWTLFNQKQDK
jgi:hypothetical protein